MTVLIGQPLEAELARNLEYDKLLDGNCSGATHFARLKTGHLLRSEVRCTSQAE
jgi:hypothetical protein